MWYGHGMGMGKAGDGCWNWGCQGRQAWHGTNPGADKARLAANAGGRGGAFAIRAPMGQ